MLQKSVLFPLLLAPHPSYSFISTLPKVNVASKPPSSLDRLGHQALTPRICGHVLHFAQRRSPDHTTPHRLGMAVDGEPATAQEKPVVEPSAGVPRGPEGSIKLTSPITNHGRLGMFPQGCGYLEGNSWMCQVNGLNLLVDPVFGTLDFGVPALFQGRKRVIRDGSQALRDIVPVTDCLVLTQGFDDHCHPPTIEAMAGMLDPSMKIIAPPSAAKVLERFFPPSRITFVIPEESVLVSKGGRAVSLRATPGARLGPPWQRKENGYIICPAPAGPGVEAPAGGSLYLEPHLMFEKAELSGLKADVVIAPIVSQIIGGYTVVGGGTKAFDLTLALEAKKLVVMMNGDLDTEGPVADMLRTEGTLESFLEQARKRGIEAIVPTPTEALSVW